MIVNYKRYITEKWTIDITLTNEEIEDITNIMELYAKSQKIKFVLGRTGKIYDVFKKLLDENYIRHTLIK